MIWAIVLFVVIAAVLVFFKSRMQGVQPTALVIMLETPRLLDLQNVVTAVRNFRPDFDSSKIHEEEISCFKMTIDGFVITVKGAPIPYLQPGMIAQIREERLKEAAERHTACILVDCISSEDEKPLNDAMPVMGQIVAELIDETSIGIISLVSQRINLITPELVEGLREGRVMEVMEIMNHDGLSKISGDDPRLKAAVKEENDRWPEFVEAWNQATDKSNFIAKFPFSDGKNTEFMWMSPVSISDTEIAGTLLNKPFKLSGFKAKSVVTASRSDLNDWAYFQNETAVGAFTEAIVRGS